MKNIICDNDRKQKYINLSFAGESRNISINDIHYFEFLDRRIVVYYDENKTFKIWSSLCHIEKQLEAYGFLRVHSAYLVQVAFIESVKRGQMFLKNGTAISFNKDYTARFKKIIKNCVNT